MVALNNSLAIPDGKADRSPAYAILPGSGSAGSVWQPAAEQLGRATVMPLPDAPNVAAMVRVLEPEVSRLSAPRVLVGSSLGALVALELARTIQVDALVLIAAGFGIKVSQPVLDVIAADRPGLLERMARGVLADSTDHAHVDLVARDFAQRGQPVLLHHMQVLAAHRIEPLRDQPPTLVLAGTRDPGVPLTDHAELASRCGGLLVPIPHAGHLPYLERTEYTVSWIRRATLLARPGAPNTAPSAQTPHRASTRRVLN